MKRTYLTLIILMLVIGFAAVTTNLVINGTINFGFNSNDFDSNVVFTYAKAKNGEANITADNKKTITFETIKLEDVNQEAILKYDIANKSLQYDASVTITCALEKDSESYQEYLKIHNSIENEFELKAGETKTGYLTVTLIKAYSESLTKDVNMICKIEATPGERNTEGTYTPVDHEYEEILLKGADPVLEATPVEEIALAAAPNEKKLIPVKIDGQGNVTRADTTKEWYNYENKEWANAVILNDGVEDPGINQPISEKQIESYFVWIPKYRYKLWNVGLETPTHTEPFTIEIEFGTEDTKDEENVSCATPLNEKQTQALSGDNKNCNNGEWMTHPAFITMGVNGFWMGKFEVGYKDATSTAEAQQGKVNLDEVIIKPDVYSWRNASNKDMFYSLKEYASNLDSHMMKNTEWGAVAYLSHSKYGINTEITQNTNPEYKTGYAKNGDSIVSYPSSNGFIASTTGNITGVYDMSGGTWDRAASYLNIENSNVEIEKSGFTKEEIANIDEKYFDVYDGTSTNTSYNKRILGDATEEMGPFANLIGSWYGDYARFADPAHPWFSRGGMHSSTSAGQFNFDLSSGNGNNGNGFRLVLAPQ